VLLGKRKLFVLKATQSCVMIAVIISIFSTTCVFWKMKKFWLLKESNIFLVKT